MGCELTTESFIKKANIIHNNYYDYSKTIYKKSKDKLIVTCPKHGSFEPLPTNHLKGSGCPECGKERACKTHILGKNRFIIRAKKIHGKKYNYDKVIYVKQYNKVIIVCLKHGDFQQTAKDHMAGKGCPECGKERIQKAKFLGKDKFVVKAKKIHGDKYNYDKVIYICRNELVIISCFKHGDFEQTPINHLRGMGCSVCRESKGENKIRKYLISHNIYFKPQHKFKSCKNKRLLRFDFVVWHNKKIKTIEFNGQQHYVPINFGGEDKFEKLERTVICDKIKIEWCKNKNIPLLIISYLDFKNINKILDDFLN